MFSKFSMFRSNGNAIRHQWRVSSSAFEQLGPPTLTSIVFCLHVVLSLWSPLAAKGCKFRPMLSPHSHCACSDGRFWGVPHLPRQWRKVFPRTSDSRSFWQWNCHNLFKQIWSVRDLDSKSRPSACETNALIVCPLFLHVNHQQDSYGMIREVAIGVWFLIHVTFLSFLPIFFSSNFVLVFRWIYKWLCCSWYSNPVTICYR